MTQKTYTDCGCEITVYGDGSAQPEITFCDLHDAAPDLLALAVESGDRNRQEVAERLREMTADERRALRHALEWLDAALDEVQFAIHAERVRERQARL